MNDYERMMLREQYNQDRIKRVDVQAKKQDNYSKEDPLNKPRHHTNCPSFSECPICYKCNNYNPTYVACLNCPLHKEDGVCHKKEIHNERIYNMMIAREKIEVNGEEK